MPAGGGRRQAVQRGVFYLRTGLAGCIRVDPHLQTVEGRGKAVRRQWNVKERQ